MSLILSYLPYAFITAYTPGPNNLLALYSFSQNGIKKGFRTIFGISLGFFFVMFLMALLSFYLTSLIPTLLPILKYIGIAYILWLSIHILRSKPTEEGQTQNGGFLTSMFLQLVNVKIYFYAITIYNVYLLPFNHSFVYTLLNAILITFIGISGCISWGLTGSLLQKQFKKHFKVLNLIMALVLLYSAYHILMG